LSSDEGLLGELLILYALTVANRVVICICPSLSSNASSRHRCLSESVRE